MAELRDDSPEFGPYRILGMLGQGGMGVVYRAHDTVNDRVVALKKLPASVADPEFRARFQRESRLAAALSHPNIVPVHDFGEIDGQLFLDMMLVDGVDLRRLLGQGAVDQDRAIAVLRQVARALDAAHEGGLVHRDVKPSNILIDGAGKAYLADFGIARETSSDATVLTQSGDLIGSWDYMAPERLSRAEVDGRADQYSLACVLFECLTGRLPYQADDMAAKVAAHLLQPPPAPSVFVPTITPALDAVVLRALAKEPNRRFESSTAMIAAAEAAAYSGETGRSANPTLPGPSKERDQGRLVKAIVRASGARRPATRKLGQPPVCPYPGLSGFERSDAAQFHGRDHVVTDLLVRLAEQLDGGEPVVVVGASGSGKSSVLRAGLLPALAGEASEREWPQIVLTPGPEPIRGLATAMAARSTAAAPEWDRVIRETPTRFGELCARSIGDATTRPVIVVDQFEELFTYGTPESDRLAYATALASAGHAAVVLAVRADLVDRCIELAPLRPALNAPVLLGPMDATELRQAIVTPARDAGLEVEPGLPERLIADLGVRGEIGYDPGALPRLAHALRETWNHREGDVLTLAAYRRVGGIDGAVSRTAEEIHDRLDPAGRQLLRTTLLRMVTVFDDGTAVRRRVDPRELPAPAIVDYLITARLVTVDGTGARLSHEALLTAWPRLRGWIDEDRAGLIQHRRFTDAVRVWAESGQHADDLYRGVRLAALTSWLDTARDRVRLQPVEQEFLVRSNAAEQAGQVAARKRTRRLRALVAALSVLLLVASGAVVVATQSQRKANAERDRADSSRQLGLSRQLAAEAAQAGGVDPRRAALTALGGWQAGDTVEARSALLAVQSDSYRGRMTGHEGPISSVAVSGDGKVAATGGNDGTLRLWDVPNRRQLAVLDDSGGWYRTVSMSVDGKLLAVANPTKQNVTVWDVEERKLVKRLPGVAIDTAMAGDGRTLAALTDKGVVIWDVEKWTELSVFQASPSIMMAYHPGSGLLATTAEQNVEVHRVSDGALVATLTGHTANVSAMAFSPDGRTMASASMDYTVRVWDTAQWTQRHVLSSSEGGFSSVAFSADGSTLVGSGIGTTVFAWDPASGVNVARLATRSVTTFGVALAGDGHTLLGVNSAGEVTVWSLLRSSLGNRANAMIAVAFQPGGDLLASVDGDGTLHLWDSAKSDLVKRIPAHRGTVFDVAFHPDGDELVTAGEDGTLVVWKADGTELRRFSRPGTVFTAVRYSPDGELIAVAGRAPIASEEDRDELLLLKASDLSASPLRRPTRAEERNEEPGQTEHNYPNGIAFSPDGRTLAVTLSGGKVGLWNLVDPGAEWTILPGHQGIAIDAEFSPDGAMLATAGSDRVVRRWRVRDGHQLDPLTGSDSTVRRVAFSPDGRTIAAAGQDTAVRLWDSASGRPLARLDRHEDQLNDVAFDSTGGRVASAGAEGVARLWDLDPAHGSKVLCGLLDRDTLADEWGALGPDRGAPPTCPN
ncbi:WD40 repeat protein [Saccharothrix tamanrassetensis]|uniref:non-specific serine/threonine protein kinase n=1 Tax=Saccharothrix tamanrassetensis TaxID=1051531 RepID=A0A841CPQ1_9PSEU|nr:protein kinase [Saccharothrix tamanrassetensis]MBB5957975.1 WD40 repeat protein [Saccharothrix tamanrassetensis]